MRKDIYLTKFDKCIEELNKVFIENSFDGIELRHNDLWQEMLKAEGAVNENWGINFPEFEKNLIIYYRSILAIIRHCKNGT